MIVVDASIVAAWFLPEEHQPFASALVVAGQVLTAPDLLPVEVASAIVKASRRRRLDVGAVEPAVRRVQSGLIYLSLADRY